MADDDNAIDETAKLRRDLANAEKIIWCLVQQAGGEASISIAMVEKCGAHADLTVFPDGIHFRIKAGIVMPKRPISLAELEAGMTPAGGWTKATLVSWGVPWPPKRGWRKELEREIIGRSAG